MKILDILDNAHVAVILDTFRGHDLGRSIGDAAVKAITNGPNSAEWKSYMSLFADNVAQLDRLTVPKAGEDGYFATGRAYIVANGTCGADTDTFVAKGVLPKIEDGLDPTPDGKIVDPVNPPAAPGATIIVRPFVIPRVPKA
jgi:hypothetical protein